MSIQRKHRIVLEPNILDDIIYQSVKCEDGSNRIIVQNDICVLGSAQKLQEIYGDKAQSILDSFKKSYVVPNGLSDDDIFSTIKDKNLQSAQSLADWFNSNIDSLNNSSSSDTSDNSNSVPDDLEENV